MNDPQLAMRAEHTAAKWDEIFEYMLDAAISMNEDGKICEWNRQAEKVFGWSRRDAIGRKLSETIIPERFRLQHEAGLKRFLRGESGSVINRRVEFFGQRKDGTEFPVELTVNPILEGGRFVFYGFLRDLSEQRQAEKTAKESLLLLTNILESTTDHISVKDKNGRFIYINSAGSQYFHAKTEDMLGKQDAGLLPPEDERRLRDLEYRVMRSGSSEISNMTFVSNNERRIFRTNISPFRDSDGEIQGVVSISQDITRFHELETEFERFFDLSLDILCIGGFDTYFKRVNLAFENLLGFSREELYSKPFIEFVHPDDRKITMQEFERLKIDGATRRFDNRYLCKDGGTRWLSWSARRANGFYYAVARDVTERKKIELDLKLSESRFRTLFEESPISIQIFAPDGKTIWVNHAWKRLWGIPQELVDRYILKEYNILRDPQVAAKGILPYLQKGFSGESTTIPAIQYETAEIPELREGSRARWVEAYIYPIKNRDGSIREVVLMHTDITERTFSETMQQLLAETGKFLETSLERSSALNLVAELATKLLGDCCIIHTIDEHGNLVKEVQECAKPSRTNAMDSFCRFTVSYPDSELCAKYVMQTGRPIFLRYISPDIAHGVEDDNELIKSFRAIGVTSVIAVPTKIQGSLIGTISIFRLGGYFNEQEFSLASELAGRAATAIHNANLYIEAQNAVRIRDDFLQLASHELRTPLTALKLQIGSLKRGLSMYDKGRYPTEKLLELIDSSSKLLEDHLKLVESLSDVSRFARKSITIQPETFNLSTVLRKIIEQISAGLSPNQRIELEAREAVIGSWDRFRIEQVIVNLLSNAIKYGMGKPIQVRLYPEDRFAVLSVTDQGIGISKQDQSRIFNRFERAVSKTYFRGLGLGLFLTKEIVQLHNGSISVNSEPGKGSTFTVRLPLENVVRPDEKSSS